MCHCSEISLLPNGEQIFYFKQKHSRFREHFCLAEGKGIEPSTLLLVRFSRPVTSHSYYPP
jgi:hypothetical protein